jgi:TonB family protein
MEDARARRRAAELSADDFATAGDHLRGVREAAGLSIEEVSERTHIKTPFIGAIETMNLEALPSRPFAIGFVKVYAEALGLDARALVARFKEDAGFSAPVEIPSEKFEATQTVGEPERAELSLFAFLAIIAFILWCAFQITRPRDVTTPFNLNTPAAESKQVAQPVSPQPSPAPAAPAANVVEAKLVERIDPVYPKGCEARAEAVETVEIAFNITPAGVISGERVVTASNPCFENAALNAARRWRFEPRKVDGAPATAYDKRYTFSFARPN